MPGARVNVVCQGLGSVGAELRVAWALEPHLVWVLGDE